MDAMPTPLASTGQVTDPAPLATDAALAAIEGSLDAIDHAERRALTPARRLGLAASARVLADRLESLAAILLAEADRADAAMTARGTPTTSWLALEGNRTRREASRLVLAAAELAEHPAVREAAVAGRLTPQQASRLGRAVNDLPDDLTQPQRAAAEQLLLERGLTTPAEKIPRLLPDIVTAVLAPAASLAEAEHRRLAVQRHYAIRRRSLTFTPDGIGSVLIRGSLPEIEASAVKKLVDSYVESDRRAEKNARAQAATSGAVSPSTATIGAATSGPTASEAAAAGSTARRAGHSTEPWCHSTESWYYGNEPWNDTHTELPDTNADPGETGADPHHVDSDRHDTAVTPAIDSPSARDVAAARDAREVRTPEQRRADALLHIAADLAATDHAPRAAGDRPRVVVIMRETDLRERAEQAGLLDNGQPIAPGDLRRLCCDADLTPAVLGTTSEILDVGRTHRLVTPAIRRALTLRDHGCAFPHCTTDAVGCDAHHIVPWWNGGTTALTNLVLLCPHHHGLVEPPRFHTDQPLDRWHVHLDDHGFPEFTPPGRLDPTQTPRRGERQPWAA